MKYHVHVYEEVRHTYEVEAESALEAAESVANNQEEIDLLYSELTGDRVDLVCVDPLLPDGTPNIDAHEWFDI